MRANAGFVVLGLLFSAAVGCNGEEAPPVRRADATAGEAKPACVVSDGDVQIGEGIGVLRPGMPVAEARARCRVVLDTVVQGAEGMPVRLLSVVLRADTVQAEVVRDTIWRLRITSPEFRTSSGVGAGTPARDIAVMAGASVQLGEGEVYMLIAGECGVSYRLTGVEFGRMAAAVRGDSALAALPEAARVDRVLMWGCDRKSGA